jgi:hypothetical protein
VNPRQIIEHDPGIGGETPPEPVITIGGVRLTEAQSRFLREAVEGAMARQPIGEPRPGEPVSLEAPVRTMLRRLTVAPQKS